MTRVAVTGSRDWRDRELVFKVLDEIDSIWSIQILIEGDARGIDKIAGEWAEARNIPALVFPADWDNITAPGAKIAYHAGGAKYNKLAGFQRNQEMINKGFPDILVAFPGNNGTHDMFIRARKRGLLIIIVSANGTWKYDDDYIHK